MGVEVVVAYMLVPADMPAAAAAAGESAYKMKWAYCFAA